MDSLITQTRTVTLRKLQCGKCGVMFAAPEALMSERNEDGGTWYCPNGHPRVFRETDVSKLEKQLAQEKQRHDQTRSELRDEKTSHTSTKGQLTKTKNRIHKGVCPCCKRSFTNVRRHMATQHPDYSE